jgi:hypothetical protein
MKHCYPSDSRSLPKNHNRFLRFLLPTFGRVRASAEILRGPGEPNHQEQITAIMNSITAAP